MDVSQMSLLWESWIDSSSLQNTGGLLTILSLLMVGYTAVRISNVARWIRDDRNAAQGFQNPVDVYFNIQKAEALLERLQRTWHLQEEERTAISNTLKGLRTSATYLASYFYFVDGPSELGTNAYLAAGRFFKARREPRKARDFYHKALHDGHLKKSEQKECLTGLMDCNILLWDLDDLARVEQTAKELRIKVSPSRARHRLLLLCVGASVSDTIKRAFLFFRGSGGRPSPPRTLKKP